MVSNLARKAKIKKSHVTPHTLRHTFATNYLKANPGSLIELAALLGHDSINTTAIYTKAIYTKASREKLAEDIERTEVNIYDD